ncbi:unnamed protein product [Rotaria sp. Silwood1]|nr:unnamed protein product [Rotaria sp. Silwood1]
MTKKNLNTKNFPLLNEIDEGIYFNNIDWNKSAFQTLLTSNLPTTTIFYYAIDVGLRRLENSLYEAYWDITEDALHDLSQFLFNSSIDKDVEGYLYEAKCQLLMYSAISIIKMNTIRRRSIHDAKMACATICLLLLERSKPYKISSTINEYSSCMRIMHGRYLKRIFIIVYRQDVLLIFDLLENIFGQVKNYEPKTIGVEKTISNLDSSNAIIFD